MNYNPTEIVTTNDLSAMTKMVIPSIRNSVIMLLQHHGVSINLSPILDRCVANSFRWGCLEIPVDGEMRLREIRAEGDELVIRIESVNYPLAKEWTCDSPVVHALRSLQ